VAGGRRADPEWSFCPGCGARRTTAVVPAPESGALVGDPAAPAEESEELAAARAQSRNARRAASRASGSAETTRKA
jgi:hypothetical protein